MPDYGVPRIGVRARSFERVPWSASAEVPLQSAINSDAVAVPVQ